MKKFSTIINESNRGSEKIMQTEITQYINKVKKKIPKAVQQVIYLTQKYNILDKDTLETIRKSSKGSLKNLAKEYNIPEDGIIDVWSGLKNIKNNIKLLPQYQSKQERLSLEKGKLAMDDLTIDLETSNGRNAAAKMYMPIVYTVVNNFVGKSKLTKQDLISAGLEGFTDAMNDYRKNPDDKHVTFKTYVGFRVRQRILNTINKYGHSLSGTSSYTQQMGVKGLDASSLDGFMDSDGDFNQDHMSSIGIKPNVHLTDKNSEDDKWKSIYKILENNFSQKVIDVFYRFFGLHGYEKEKTMDIAKRIGVSRGNIRNSYINKVLKFLKNDPKTKNILDDILELYSESLMIDMINMDKPMITETLSNDDTYILLEELTPWRNKYVFMSKLDDAEKSISNEETKFIISLRGYSYMQIDNIFKKHKQTLINFLRHMYPTTNFASLSDVSIIEMMVDVCEAYDRYMK